MSLNARVALSIDAPRKTLIFRYIGNLTGPELYAQVLAHMATVDAPWEYDFLVDARRLEGIIQASDTEAFGKHWAELAQGRDDGRRIVVISEDPLIRARKSLRDAIFPNRFSTVVTTMNEALEWLKLPADQLEKAA